MALCNEAFGQLADTLNDSSSLDSGQTLTTVITSLIRSVRERLRMEVGFVSHFAGGQRVFLYVDAQAGAPWLEPGSSDPLEESYCQRIVDGRLPQLMTDSRDNPEARTLAATFAIPVGAHISVPVRLMNGQVYGTFCLFSRYAQPGLNHRSLALVRVFADVIAALVDDAEAAGSPLRRRRQEVSQLLEKRGFTFIQRPVKNLLTDTVAAYELVAQLDGSCAEAMHLIRESDQLGLSAMYGVCLAEAALKALRQLPDQAQLALNVTPDLLQRFDLLNWFAPEDSHRLVLQISERDPVDDYENMNLLLHTIKACGFRIAVDDAGAGYASMRHILQFRPDFIKLDASLIRNIHARRDQQAMVSALQIFARNQGCMLVAGGVDSVDEYQYLVSIGMTFVEGQYIESGLSQV